ncbi:MAG TPA: V-type ATP synthase subunit D [Syntrophales bacterium]|nr:V-type ATP synthase subunit D [Syntrophales bacterium]
MTKIKFTQGELKRQRDLLKQYERFLPTLQLKKQQLQLELNNQILVLETYRSRRDQMTQEIIVWMGLPEESKIVMNEIVIPRQVFITSRNIAGVDIPVFDRVEFGPIEYDLFSTPLWLDHATKLFMDYIALLFQVEALQQGMELLKRELLITTQRVNLFEKIKIPETQENIRLIKIYIGDQLAASIGRSKLVKRRSKVRVRKVA